MKSHDTSHQLRRVKRITDPLPGRRWYAPVALHIRYQVLCQSRCPTKFHVKDCKYVETSVRVSPAPGGWHFIPNKRCSRFGQCADTGVTPIWRCTIQSFTYSCIVDVRELLALKCFLHKTCRQPKHSAKERNARPPSDIKMGRGSGSGKKSRFGVPSSKDFTNAR